MIKSDIIIIMDDSNFIEKLKFDESKLKLFVSKSNTIDESMNSLKFLNSSNEEDYI